MSTSITALCLTVLSLLFLLVCFTQAAKLPVLLMHGITAQEHHLTKLKQYCEEAGHPTYVITTNFGVSSVFEPLSKQLKNMEDDIARIKKQYGIGQHHLICHSMGGLLCRGYLQSKANHGVQTFISLASPQMGQFGIPQPMQEFLPPAFRNVAKEGLHTLMYQPATQTILSIANFWKDPFQNDKYRKVSTYLAPLNGESSSGVDVSKYRTNFLKLKKAVFLGSMADEVIQPQFSSLLKFWKVTSARGTYEIVPMTQQPVYKSDLFGLQTMHKDGRLTVTEVQNVKHNDWLVVKSLFTQYMKPYLT